MTKIVKAVQPYIHNHFVNFKLAPYNSWTKLGGKNIDSHYPPRILHGVVYKLDFPTLYTNNDTAVLAFIEPVSLNFDTFPYYITHEIIPVFWDVWPMYFEKVCQWLKRHKVRTAVFTSSQTADMIREKFPAMNICTITEGIDSEIYNGEKKLKDRTYDYLEYGRCSTYVDSSVFGNEVKILRNSNGEILNTREKLVEALGDSRIMLCLSRYVTNPELAGNIDTLTQRFWEGLLSGTVVLGHAPKELIDLMGYNPIIELDKANMKDQVCSILNNLEEYQELVDKNRGTALRLSHWDIRIKQIMNFLKEKGYEI